MAALGGVGLVMITLTILLIESQQWMVRLVVLYLQIVVMFLLGRHQQRLLRYHPELRRTISYQAYSLEVGALAFFLQISCAFFVCKYKSYEDLGGKNCNHNFECSEPWLLVEDALQVINLTRFGRDLVRRARPSLPLSTQCTL